MDFIANGCQYNDDTLDIYLKKAYGQCREEIYTESIRDLSIVSYSSSMYVHATIDLPFWVQASARTPSSSSSDQK